jgi:hypothetical protein
MNPGGRPGGKSKAPSKKQVAQYQPSLYDKKDQKSVHTLRRAMAYERSNGATPDDRIMVKLKQRLDEKVAKIARSAGSNRGIRLNIRSKGQAAANYRQKVKNTRNRAINGYNWSGLNDAQRKVAMRAGGRAPERQVLSRRSVTRGQGNLFTGGFSDRTGSRMQPVVQFRGSTKDRPTSRNTVRL